VAIGISVDDVVVRSLDVDHFEVSWKLKPTSQDILDYTFQVLRSEAAMGPFEAVSAEMDDRFFFVDNRIASGNDFRQWFYTIRVKDKQSGDTKDFGPVSPGADADLIAAELRKHINLLMQEFIGRRCWVFPVRTFGQRCSCWNPTLQKRTRSHCLTCYDTGFVRGYMTPIEVWASIDPDTKNEQNMTLGPTQQSNTSAKLGFFPPVKPRDVIVEAENIRWRIVTVGGTEQVRAQVHQEITLHKIPSTDIEYRLPLDPGGALQNLWLSPPRNFSNPHNYEGFTSEDYINAQRLYTSRFPQ
jgi:hypothetical protein